MSLLPVAEENALRERFQTVLARLDKAAKAAGKTAGDVRLIAVSKFHSPEMVASLARMWTDLAPSGTPAFGENYVQEALDKQAAVARMLGAATGAPSTNFGLEWHFIGHVQSRKARETAGRFAFIHTLDSAKLAGQTAKAVREGNLPPQPVLIQVNIGDEPQKSGVDKDKAEELITAVRAMPELSVEGLMCLPPFFDQGEKSRPYFIRLRGLRDALAKNTGLALTHLSMGMSHDFEVAVAEGATMVRVGTDIFGARPARE